MDNEIVEQLTQKITDSRACLSFMFTQDGHTQSFVHGSYHEIIATIANEMQTNEKVEAFIRGAVGLIEERRKQS
jgi:hypothetical protein